MGRSKSDVNTNSNDKDAGNESNNSNDNIITNKDKDGSDGPGEASSSTGGTMSMISSPARGTTSMMMKRDSIMADDLAYFDPDSLEGEDDWRGIFDDDEGNGSGPATPTRGGRGKSSSAPSSSLVDDKPSPDALSTDGLDDTDPLSARALMPPPTPVRPGASDSPQRPFSVSSLRGIEELSSNRPPLDHSITRKMKTAQNSDRINSAPPTWHSDAADKPHRKAMVQDM